jgi:hypothetical protein
VQNRQGTRFPPSTHPTRTCFQERGVAEIVMRQEPDAEFLAGSRKGFLRAEFHPSGSTRAQKPRLPFWADLHKKCHCCPVINS